jgi:hypothetical protein
LTERHEPEAAARCLEIADAVNKMLAEREPPPDQGEAPPGPFAVASPSIVTVAVVAVALVALLLTRPFTVRVAVVVPISIFARSRRHGGAAAGIVAVAVAPDAHIRVDVARADLDAAFGRGQSGAGHRPMVPVLGLRRGSPGAQQNRRRYR